MWINKPEYVRRIKPSDYPESIALGDGDTAQVTEAAGEYLIEHFDDFSET